MTDPRLITLTELAHEDTKPALLVLALQSTRRSGAPAIQTPIALTHDELVPLEQTPFEWHPGRHLPRIDGIDQIGPCRHVVIDRRRLDLENGWTAEIAPEGHREKSE